MFNLFKKQPPEGSGLHPLKIDFARRTIPSLVRDYRMAFIGTLANGECQKLLEKTWKQQSDELPRGERIKSDGVEVTAFKEDPMLVGILIFPAPQWDDEPYFGAVVFGPPEGGEWTPESMESAPYRYFVSVKKADGTRIEELNVEAEEYQPPADGPEPDAMLFVEWVMNAAVREFCVTSVRSNDEAMVAAIEKAKATLQEVTDQFLAGDLENFTVKVPVSDSENTEHFWLSNTSYSELDGSFSGTLDAEPQMVTGVTEGQSYEAAFGDVSDWMYMKDGKMYGNHTLRALLPHMPPSEAEKYGALLADVE